MHYYAFINREQKIIMHQQLNNKLELPSVLLNQMAELFTEGLRKIVFHIY